MQSASSGLRSIAPNGPRTEPREDDRSAATFFCRSLYCSGAIGGNINLVTKRPKADSETLVQGGIGTSDYYRATIDSNVRVNDQIAVRLNAMYHENDVPARQVDHYKRWGVAPSVKLGVDGPTSATLMFVHQEDKNTPLYGVPYYKNAVYDGPLPGVPYSSYMGYPNLDKQDQTVDQATLIFDHQFSDTVSLRNLSRWQHVQQDLVVNPPQGAYCLANGTSATGAACAAGQQPGYYYPSGPRGGFRHVLVADRSVGEPGGGIGHEADRGELDAERGRDRSGFDHHAAAHGAQCGLGCHPADVGAGQHAELRDRQIDPLLRARVRLGHRLPDALGDDAAPHRPRPAPRGAHAEPGRVERHRARRPRGGVERRVAGVAQESEVLEREQGGRNLVQMAAQRRLMIDGIAGIVAGREQLGRHQAHGQFAQQPAPGDGMQRGVAG